MLLPLWLAIYIALCMQPQEFEKELEKCDQFNFGSKDAYGLLPLDVVLL